MAEIPGPAQNFAFTNCLHGGGAALRDIQFDGDGPFSDEIEFVCRIPFQHNKMTFGKLNILRATGMICS
jgi:hypothetical protein